MNDSRQNRSMLATLAFMATQTMTLVPSDDVWIYPHASDAAGDSFLRVWGIEGKAVPSDAGEAEDFSMAFLKWSLAGTPAGQKLAEAKLILTHIGKPGFTLDQAKNAPLQARAMPVSFSEKGWDYAKVGAILPKGGEETLYGSGSPASLDGETLTITIDLLRGKGDFARALAAAQQSASREIAIAITSPINISDTGQSGIYKFYSKEAEVKERWPKLVLVWQ
jgi:hypothetical protein